MSKPMTVSISSRPLSMGYPLPQTLKALSFNFRLMTSTLSLYLQLTVNTVYSSLKCPWGKTASRYCLPFFSSSSLLLQSGVMQAFASVRLNVEGDSMGWAMLQGVRGRSQTNSCVFSYNLKLWVSLTRRVLGTNFQVVLVEVTSVLNFICLPTYSLSKDRRMHQEKISELSIRLISSDSQQFLSVRQRPTLGFLKLYPISMSQFLSSTQRLLMIFLRSSLLNALMLGNLSLRTEGLQSLRLMLQFLIELSFSYRARRAELLEGCPSGDLDLFCSRIFIISFYFLRQQGSLQAISFLCIYNLNIYWCFYPNCLLYYSVSFFNRPSQFSRSRNFLRSGTSTCLSGNLRSLRRDLLEESTEAFSDFCLKTSPNLLGGLFLERLRDSERRWGCRELSLMKLLELMLLCSGGFCLGRGEMWLTMLLSLLGYWDLLIWQARMGLSSNLGQGALAVASRMDWTELLTGVNCPLRMEESPVSAFLKLNLGFATVWGIRALASMPNSCSSQLSDWLAILRLSLNSISSLAQLYCRLRASCSTDLISDSFSKYRNSPDLSLDRLRQTLSVGLLRSLLSFCEN